MIEIDIDRTKFYMKRDVVRKKLKEKKNQVPKLLYQHHELPVTSDYDGWHQPPPSQVSYRMRKR